MKIHLNRWQQAVRKAQAFIAVAVGLLFCAIGTATAQDMSHHHMELNADPTAETEITDDWAKRKLAKSPRHPEGVKRKNGGRGATSLIVYPDVITKATVVVVISAILG